jgi:hypothetical protein
MGQSTGPGSNSSGNQRGQARILPKKHLEAAGIETRSSSPEELGGFVKKENVRFASVIERAGIKPN